MKESISIVKTLLKKQWIESSYSYKRGNFDVVGFLLRLLIIAAFAAVFVIFFGRFASIYAGLQPGGVADPEERAYELLSIVYMIVIVFMVIGAVSQINREIFAADDIKLFSAMPVDARSIFIAKLITIYLGQLLISAIAVLAVNITMALHLPPQGASYYLLTVLAIFIIPLITIAIASLLALPFNLLKNFLNGKFLLSFLLITAVTGALFYLYSIVLGAVKDMLIGDSIKYFFNAKVMSNIANAVRFMFPANWFAGFVIGKNRLFCGLFILAALAVCVAVSLVIIRAILVRALQSRIAGTVSYLKRKQKISPDRGGFFSLIKKEFLLIFRTPSYMFSYFSVAVIMPLMVYFCMSIGSSMVQTLVGLECNLELALFLTLLFGALTNIFCATNISREGAMFYSLKAMPLSCKSVMFSKILLCMAVTVISQLASAILLLCTGFLNAPICLFIFVVGTAFSFVHICVATRYDFNHARFSTEEDGEIKESGNVVSTIIILGLLISVIVGGSAFLLRIIMLLRGVDLVWLTYLISGAAAVISAVLAYLYFILGLDKKYYEFEGGGV